MACHLLVIWIRILKTWRKKMKSRFFILVVAALFAACSLQNNDVQQGVLSAREAEYFASNAIDMFFKLNPDGEFGEWLGAGTGNAVLIKDIEENPVLYDVPVVKEGKQIGIVQVLADNTLENPLYTVSTSTILLEYNLQIKQSESALNRETGGVQLSNPRIIYYDFPERAVAFDKGEKGVQIILIDIATKEILPENMIVPYKKAGVGDIKTESSQKSEIGDRQNSRSMIITGTALSRGITSRNLPVPLIPQQDHYLCVPASIEMIWRYESPENAQSQGFMKIPNCNWTSGCFDNEAIAAYLRANGFGSEYIGNKASDEVIIQEIGSNHPFMSLIDTMNGRHSRVVTGYFNDTIYGFWARINDPAPMNRGSQYWESRENTYEFGYITVAYEIPASSAVPDLFCSYITSSQNSYFSGDNCTFTAMIKNTGKNAASGIQVRWDVDGSSIKTDTINTLLQPGETEESICTWTAYPVTHNIKCSIDPDNAIHELNEENNDAEINVYVYYGERPQEPTPEPPLPDLVCHNIPIPADMRAGDKVTFTATIYNAGSEDTGNVDVKWFIDGQFIRSDMISSPLQPGGSRDVSFDWTAYHGEHRVRIDVDPDNNIVEKNEANNSYESDAFYVNDIPNPTETPTSPPGTAILSCSGISGPAVVYMGSSATYSTTIRNSGNASSGSFTVTWSVDGSSKSSGTMSLAAGGSASSFFTWTANVNRGDHTISMSAGSGCSGSKGVFVDMAPTVTNPPPTAPPPPVNQTATPSPAPQPTPPYCPTCPY
jgi:hypothetical protein